MSDAGPDWDLYRAFLAVLETGSLSAAARKLGIAQPTVGRHIEALEQALSGTTLFTRSPGGLRPTEAAQALAPHAQAMAAAAETLVRTASGEAAGVRGVIRVTASDIVGAEILPEILTSFRESYPKVVIELVLSNRQEDLLRRDADIAVRMARPTQNALTARRVGAARIGFFAHKRYLRKHGTPTSMADLRSHTLIGFDRDPPPREALDLIGIDVFRDLFALRTDSDLAQLAAIRAGFGIGGCQAAIAGRDPNLSPILADEFGFDLETWVVMHEDLKSSRRMRLMFDHLVEGLKDHATAR
jgi:DNA-binding transcriptional LysR family regulator